MVESKEQYIPGACNIGSEERRMRKIGGWAGTGLFLLLYAALLFTHAPHWSLFFLFVPALLSATGWVQYANHFCVNFGMRGLRNMDKPAFQTENVVEEEFRRKDRERSLKLIGLSVAVSLAVTLIAYFVRP